MYYLIIPIIYYASSQFVFIYLFLSLSHISFWMADANAIYHSSLIIYYSSTLFVLFDHHYYYTDHLSLFNFIFSSHISLLMADANAIYHFSLIICYSWTEHIITHQIFVVFVFVDAMFISSFFLSRLTFVQFGIHSVVSSYAWFFYFYFVLPLLGLHISIMFIPHCKYFFLSSCTRNMAHNAVNTRSQSLLHRKYTCTRPVRQMPFGVTSLKIED